MHFRIVLLAVTARAVAWLHPAFANRCVLCAQRQGNRLRLAGEIGSPRKARKDTKAEIFLGSFRAFRGSLHGLRMMALALALAARGANFFALHAEDLPPLTVPVRVHLLRSEQEAALNTTLTEADVARIFGKVNKIWAQAGIRFEVESVGETHMLAAGRALPKERLLKDGLNVSYIKSSEENGFWTGELVVVKDTAWLKKVPGGLDEPIPRVTAHELGHALGLEHRQDVTNLMASGTTGFSLNESESKTARAGAAKFVAGKSGEARQAVVR